MRNKKGYSDTRKPGKIKLSYWKCLGIYAAVLAVFAVIMIIYTGSCLKKYEIGRAHV